MADLSYTVRYFSTIISPCLQFTSTTTIKIPPCGAHWGKIPAHLVGSRGLCVRVAPMWRPVCGAVLGPVVNGRPSGEQSLSPHSERALQAAITVLPPSHRAIAFIPLDVSTNKARYHKNRQTHLEMIGECGRETRCCCLFESLQSASSALFFRFNANILF